MLHRGLMDSFYVRRLTPEIANVLIERIEIHNPEKNHSHNTLKVNITFTAIGSFSISEEKALAEMVQKLAEKKHKLQSSS